MIASNGADIINGHCCWWWWALVSATQYHTAHGIWIKEL